MPEEDRSAERRRQIEVIKRRAHVGPDGRGVYLPGLWSARMAAGLTQRELAAAIGSNQATIHQLERLLRAAYPKTIRKLCAALNAEPVDLMCAEAAGEE